MSIFFKDCVHSVQTSFIHLHPFKPLNPISMSTNMTISKDLLSAVQKLSASIKGQEITDELINELRE